MRSACLLLVVFIVGYVAIVALIYVRQRKMLYFPTHHDAITELMPWREGARLIGYCKEVPSPHTIWLMLHGNAGQASDRDYALRRISPADSLYVLEYPGYGLRAGSPSYDSMNAAALDAYRLLRKHHPQTAIGVIGESIGSGPASSLAQSDVPPDKIVLVVPFDSLSHLAARHLPLFPARLLLRDRWDNVAALKTYRGPIEIFGAANDSIIPLEHARNLANHLPESKFHVIPSDHNDWSSSELVKIER